MGYLGVGVGGRWPVSGKPRHRGIEAPHCDVAASPQGAELLGVSENTMRHSRVLGDPGRRLVGICTFYECCGVDHAPVVRLKNRTVNGNLTAAVALVGAVTFPTWI